MTQEEDKDEPFIFRLLRICLEEERDSTLPSDELTDKQLFSTFAFIIVAVAILALTIGPFSLLK